MAAADAGADDVALDGDVFQVTSAPESLGAVRDAIEAAGLHDRLGRAVADPEDDGRGRGRGAPRSSVMRLIDALEDNDDVQDVYANFDIPEQVLEAVAG